MSRNRNGPLDRLGRPVRRRAADRTDEEGHPCADLLAHQADPLARLGPVGDDDMLEILAEELLDDLLEALVDIQEIGEYAKRAETLISVLRQGRENVLDRFRGVGPVVEHLAQ